MRTSRAAAPMLFLLLGVAVGACSSNTGGAAGASGTPAPAATPAAAAGDAYGAGAGAATKVPAAMAATVNLGDTSLGKVLVDGAGLTLYAFTADGGGKSACNGGCAANWPPLAGGAAPTLGAGLSAADFASITRDDGSVQATFHGMPLYNYAGDKAAGDVNGQGLSGKWYVVGADGKLVK